MDLYLEHEYERQDAICGALLIREEFEEGKICEKCKEEQIKKDMSR